MSGRVLLIGFSALAAVLCGCGSQGQLTVTSPELQTPSEAATNSGPPKCDGQLITHGHAEVGERIPRGGASLCVPSIRGFGGFLGFPGVHPAPQPVKLIVNVPKRNPHVIFNLEWLPSGQFTFGKMAPPGGITGSTMVPGKTYTGYGVMYFKGNHKDVGPCYSVVKRGKYGGVFNNLGTLMEKQGGSVLEWDLSIVNGKDTNRRC